MSELLPVKNKFYRFRQNNSGGSFKIDKKKGIGTNVFIEASSYEDANERAEEIGLYFYGCDKGVDCNCCGDRWSKAYNNTANDYDVFDSKEDFINKDYYSKDNFIHYLNKGFEPILNIISKN